MNLCPWWFAQSDEMRIALRIVAPHTVWMACFILSACQSYVPVSVRVVDAESLAPVSGAKVETNYVTELGFVDFWRWYLFKSDGITPSSAITDDGGRAVIQVSGRRMVARGVKCDAQGYLQTVAGIGTERFDAIRGDRPRSPSMTDLPVDVTVRLYREPHPTLMVVVPNGYRGLLRLDSSAPTTRRSLGSGERTLEVFVRSPQPQKLPMVVLGERHVVDPWHFTARYADGTSIPQAIGGGGAGADQIALRHVSSHNMRELFVIGSEIDRQRARDQVRRFPEILTGSGTTSVRESYGGPPRGEREGP
jgi:hypothetical protein